MKFHLPVTTLLALALLAGCRESKQDSHAGHGHQHTPPHGGTAVVLGDEEYHLEFVIDPAAGRLQAFVLDGHMDRFIRLTNETFSVSAKAGDNPETLVFHAMPNAATGERIGDTALFEAQAGWLKTTNAFDAVIDELHVRGRRFEKVGFNFPRGNGSGTNP